VLVLLDIDALKRCEREADAARSFAEATIRAVRDPLVVLDGALRVKTANDALQRMLGVAACDSNPCIHGKSAGTRLIHITPRSLRSARSCPARYWMIA